MPPGKESIFVIGAYPVLSLEEARSERAALREMVKARVRPAEARRQEKQVALEKQEAERIAVQSTFEAIALDWHSKQKEQWTPAHAEAVIKSLQRYAFNAIGPMQVEQITPPMVLEVVRAIEDKGALEIASKTLQRIHAVFRFAVQTGCAVYNPAADMRGALRAKRVKHRAMILITDMPEFLVTVAAGDIHTTTKNAILFTILTAARSGEVRGATWAEIDMDKKLWSIPAERMKMRNTHKVPLSRQALSILRSMQSHAATADGYIFPGIHNPHQPLSGNTMLYALYRIGYHSISTMHGFRATLSKTIKTARVEVYSS